MKAVEVDSITLKRARKLRREAVEDVVNESFPSVTRIAHALAGTDPAGAAIVARIVRRGLLQIPKFRDAGEPQRWFLRHTILACRAEPGPPPAADADLLVTCAATPSLEYAAFIKALRGLPQQQMEAFVLHHAEAFNARYTAVAMDCSTTAAQQHLDTADKALRAIAGDAFDPCVATLRQAYQSLTPAARVQTPHIRSIIRRHVWPRRLWRGFKVLLLCTVLVGVAWFLIKVLPRIEY